ncbi:MAG: hypothetical protein BA863_02020 [Desulfovibrio sp. S3730MH75]|nr:MAG: hypothetical protein BA863_02020 [Desulfovibrio sp. S3730MH75]
MCAGTTVVTVDQNILWEGFLGETRAPQKLYFRNNCSIQDAFCIERTSDKDESRWGAEGCSCGSATDCDNVRLDAGVYLDNYKIHTPIVLNILEIDSTYQKSWDACNDLGSQSQSDYLVELKMVSDGEYSDKTIVQAYTVEARTVERTATCCIDQYGNCQGLGCVPPDDCPWQDEMYTRYGLEVAAQVGFIPGGTDGVNPTSLPRNIDFESAIKSAYNQVRINSGLQDDELLELNLSMVIYKGTI